MKIITLLLALIIIVSWGLWGFLNKVAISKIGLQVSFWNALSLTLIIVAFLIFTHQLFPIKINPLGISLAILAGIFSGLASLLFYILLGKNPVGFLIALTALYPLVTIILSILFLKEPLTLTRVIGFVFALAALFFLSL